MGAYCILDQATCRVSCLPSNSSRRTASHQWVNDAPSRAAQYDACTFWDLYACPWPRPQCCNTRPPANSKPPSNPPAQSGPPAEGEDIPPSSPVTGPKPEDPCLPSMSQRDDGGVNGVPVTQDHLTMPHTFGIHSVRTGKAAVGSSTEPPYTGAPLLNRQGRVVTQGRVRGAPIIVAEPATGDGFMVVHPPDLNEFQLRGDGVHPDAKEWPPAIALTTLLLLNGAGRDSQAATTLLAWGMPSARTRGKPVTGIYAEYDPSTQKLDFQATDEDGADDSVGGLCVNGDAVAVNSVFTHSTTATLDKDAAVILCDTDSAAFVLSLDASPTQGQTYRIVNVGSSGNDLTIRDTNNNIKGSGSDYVREDGLDVWLTFDAAQGWW